MENEVCHKTSEASADLLDFLPVTTGISTPFARENLHLVILNCIRIQPLVIQ